ncbi:MAG: lamin tail domain-containing protein [Bacteroidales bacterium]
MKPKVIVTLVTLMGVLLSGCGKDSSPKTEDIGKFNGVVINEIAAHDEVADEDSWVELINTSSSDVDISGLGLYLYDDYFTGKCVYTAPAGTSIASKGRLVISTQDESLVTGILSTSDFELKLALSNDGTAVDDFNRKTSISEPAALSKAGSYQRIPDGSSTWRAMTYSSKSVENKVFSIDDLRPTAVWVWRSYLETLLADGCAKLKELKAQGFDHILLNYSAFEYDQKRTRQLIDASDDLGIAVHAWMQCFHTSEGWINPVDDAANCYKDEIFEDIIAHAKAYIEDFGVKGLHLDYIRYPGTAYKHNPSAEVTAVGAVNRCCRELRELVDSYNEGIVTSAALMPEKSGAYYYAQDYNAMGTYLHILMPMIYKYSYGYGDDACRSYANMFASNTGGAKCWPGTTTYKGNDSSVSPMDAAGILADCKVYQGTKASGIVLFRYGLGTFPDLSDFWSE